MSNETNATETVPAVETTPAKRGRKPSFPGQESKVFAVGSLPLGTQAMLRTLAARNAENAPEGEGEVQGRVNVALDAVIRSAFDASEKSVAKAAARATAKAEKAAKNS